MTDAVEDAFTVQMPKGWRNLAYTARAYDITRFVLNSVSPDGSTVLFIGDPTIPIYFEPSFQYINVTRSQARVNPLIRVGALQPALSYMPDYVKRKFGKLDGFHIISTGDDPANQALTEQKLREEGTPGEVTSAKVSFQYVENGKTMNAMVIGGTTHFKTISSWAVGVGGITTPGDPESYRDMLESWARTFKVKPEWTAKQKALHEQRMAEIQRAGQNSRMRLQAMADQHQARMNAIRAAGDASMKSYYERSAASDVSHRNFLNYINEENTVASSDGKTYQVTTGYQRYFMHKRTGAYVGGDTHMTLDSLRKMGLNPDDYTEVKIKK